MFSMSQTVLKKWFHNVKYTTLHISIWGNKQDILPWFLFSFPLVLSCDPPLVFSYFSWAFHHDLIQNIENGITAKGIWRSARVHMSAACSSLSCGWSCPLIFSPLIVWGQVYMNTLSQPGPETPYVCKALVWPVSFKLDICTLGCPVDWWWLDTEQAVCYPLFCDHLMSFGVFAQGVSWATHNPSGIALATPSSLCPAPAVLLVHWGPRGGDSDSQALGLGNGLPWLLSHGPKQHCSALKTEVMLLLRKFLFTRFPDVELQVWSPEIINK